MSTRSKLSEEEISINHSRRASSNVAAEQTDEAKPTEMPPPPKPVSWAALLRPTQPQAPPDVRSFTLTSNGIAVKGETLSEVLNNVNTPVEPPSKVSFLQPRGLVNTGNMCYMNSVCIFELLRFGC